MGCTARLGRTSSAIAHLHKIKDWRANDVQEEKKIEDNRDPLGDLGIEHLGLTIKLQHHPLLRLIVKCHWQKNWGPSAKRTG